MENEIIGSDQYVGLIPINGYVLTKLVGKGGIGKVYRAERKTPKDTLACKVIAEKDLKLGWEKEVEKVALLRGIPNVVQYRAHGSAYDNNQRPYHFIIWDFIEGVNLSEYLELPSTQLNIAFVEELCKTILRVLIACKAVGIQHGDLHEGNILISNPDPRIAGSPRIVWVSDFGYGGSHNNLQPKDDFKQFASIGLSLLKRIEISKLNPLDKILHTKIDTFLKRKVLEVDATQGVFVGNPEYLLNDFTVLKSQAEREAAAASGREGMKEPGDYLWAEALGYQVDEWKNLFVPEFLAAQDLLSRNITVLTGARGCGKTMAFRRLTVFMDKVIGESSGVPGSDQFSGFYLNCRDLTEAFPWIPPRLNIAMEQQIIHFFHLAWYSEILKTIGVCDPNRDESYEWLDDFMQTIFPNKYYSLPQGGDILTHVRTFIEDEKERCRLSDLGKIKGYSAWPLARMDFLDLVHLSCQKNLKWIGDKPLFLFLDDYTIPIVPRDVQLFLNAIIFKRRSNLFFKISTESTNSFVREGQMKKPLELHQDFELVDLASESLHQNERDRARLLDKIFRPRIERHGVFTGKHLGLIDVLGKSSMSNNHLAKQMRLNAQKGSKKALVYHGASAFFGMWSSDIRIMIQMFTDMLREANGTLGKSTNLIPPLIQNKWYRVAGGEFLAFAESVRDPSYWEKGPLSTKRGEPYGTQLKNIVEAFVSTSKYELSSGKLVKNQNRLNPKQAFRIEIIDQFDLPPNALTYFEGLIRWHIFLQDWRGKSVRGMITPRLYLNRVLIPHSALTFSSHDNIHLTNSEFTILVTDPKNFFKYWTDKRTKKKKNRKGVGQNSLPFMDSQSSLNTKIKHQ